MNLHWIRRQLYHWGLRNRAQGIGYPTMATMEKARVGRGGVFEGPSLPPDLEDVDLAVRRLEPQHKLVIAECYTHWGTHADHMIRLRMSERTYFRRKNLAETRVYSLLQRDSDFLQSALG
jgi:hypothetical protein